MIADSRTIYAFVTKGEKFPACPATDDKTCDVQCKVKISTYFLHAKHFKLTFSNQAVDNLNTITLGSSRKIVPAGRVYTGKDCEWIDLNKVNI